MKNNIYRNIKISSLVVLVLLLGWYFLWTLPIGGESYLTYEEMIKGQQEIYGYGCDSSLVDQVDGLFCNDYPQLANLDGNSDYSESEKMLTRAIQVHNSRISDSTFDRNITFWMVVFLALIMALNMIMDLKYKK